MPNKNVVEIGLARHALATCQLPQLRVLCNLPDVPVLSETLLLMELTVRVRAVDLTQVSRVILSDLGAAAQVFRLAGRECGPTGLHPRRIEDCISGLGLNACFEAMSKSRVTRSTCHSDLPGTWAHAREVAGFSSSLAGEMAGSATPEDAYLVGLFHVLGALPALLGWDWATQSARQAELAGFRIAEAWSLPECVLEYFSDHHARKKPNQWMEIVEKAHHLAIV